MRTPPQIEPADPRHIPSIQELRRKVWAELGTPEALVSTRVADGHDDHAHHLIWRDDHGEIAAAGRLCVHESLESAPLASAFDVPGLRLPAPLAFALRVVVAAPHRGRGLGTELERALFAMARDLGCGCVVNVVRPDRVNSSHRIGASMLATANLSAWPAMTGETRFVMGIVFR